MAPWWHPHARRPALRTSIAVAALLAAAVASPGRALGDERAAADVRFGVSREVFRDVNDNDAAVALAAYSKSVGDDYGVKARVVILEGPHGARDALKRKEVDLVNIAPTQFLELDEEDIEGPILVSGSNRADPFEHYVLLVRTDSPIHTVADLRGRSVVRSDDLRSALGAPWLEVLLHQNGLVASSALARLDVATKPAQAVLPVFFGKYDACVATRQAWDVMGEMNPQVKRQLRAIAESPPLVSGMAVFRRGVPPEIKQGILEVIGASQKKPSFQQLLTLFKISYVTVQPASNLRGTLQLLAEHRRLSLEPRHRKASLSRTLGATAFKTP